MDRCAHAAVPATFFSKARGRLVIALLITSSAILLTFAASAFGSGKGPVSFIGGNGTTGGLFNGPRGVAVNQSTGATYVVDLSNNRVQEFDAAGNFVRAWGKDVVASGAGNANEMQSVMTNAAAGQFTLSFSGETTTDLQYNATAAEVQAALNALPAINTGGGLVTVVGGPGNPEGTNPYLVNFNGGPLAGVDQPQLTGANGATPLSGGSGIGSNAITVSTFAAGGGEGTSFEICEAAAQCKGGNAAASGGALATPQGIAVDQTTGVVYVTEQGGQRVDQFTDNGYFLRSFGVNVISAGPHEDGAGFEICTSSDTCATAANSTGEGGFSGAFTGFPAVVPSTATAAGNLVVADPGGKRIQEFSSVGSFIRAIGYDVVSAGPDNTGTGLEICKAGIDTCKAGVAGPGNGQFSNSQPRRVAVDSGGFIYTVETGGNARVQRFSPSGLSAAVFAAATLSGSPGVPGPTDIAVNEANDHVFVARPLAGFAVCPQQESRIYEFDQTSNLVGVDGVETQICPSNGLALRSATGDLFISTGLFGPGGVYRINTTNAPEAQNVSVTDIAGTTATFEGEINPTGLPTGYYFEYSTDDATWARVPASEVPVGAEDSNFHHVSEQVSGLTGSQLYHVRLAAQKHYLLGPAIAGTSVSGETTFTTAAARPEVTAPAASQLKPTAATLNGRINPQNEATSYHFEYGTDGPCSSNPCASTPTANMAAGAGQIAVSEGVSGLQPGTIYYFRLMATNATGTNTSIDVTFRTPTGTCPNELMRSGPAANLADCRAYELVSPPDTQGVPPNYTTEPYFTQHTVTPDGENVVFMLKGAALAGTEATGTQDVYESIRSPNGWSSKLDAPTARQSLATNNRGMSSDHGFGFFDIFQQDLTSSKVLRYPDGTLQVLGEGTLGTDSAAIGRWISPAATHVIFTSGMQLEEDAPTEIGPGSSIFVLNIGENSPVNAVYERTPTEVRTVSLLPGDLTPPPGSTTYYRGASADGSAVVFNVDGTMYVRRNTTTYPVVTTPEPGEITYEGVSEDGTKVFYIQGGLEGGKLFEYDVLTEDTNQLSAAADAQIANISADGSHVYFVSREQFDGASGTIGANSLYVWDGSSARFIAELGSSDIEQDSQVSVREGLLHWGVSIGSPQVTNATGPGKNAARTTPDGSVLVFRARTQLTDYNNQGHSEIYRYDSGSEELTCVSCSPLGDPPQSDALLTGVVGATTPTLESVDIANVTDDGKQVFFMTSDPLVAEDTDNRQDVYRWKEGDVTLISFPHSASADEWLYGMTPDGHDVFFTSNDILVPQDSSAATSIYDARVDGGFAALSGGSPCVEDGCQGAPPVVQPEPSSGSGSFAGPGNTVQQRCRKGRKRLNGKCTPRKRHRKRHKKTHQRHAQKSRNNERTGGKA